MLSAEENVHFANVECEALKKSFRIYLDWILPSHSPITSIRLPSRHSEQTVGLKSQCKQFIEGSHSKKGKTKIKYTYNHYFTIITIVLCSFNFRSWSSSYYQYRGNNSSRFSRNFEAKDLNHSPHCRLRYILYWNSD